ncbi:cache domain-containing protein [Massilia sp. H-1]|nr:cache domain-containing protein [Massilia sp. H-1]
MSTASTLRQLARRLFRVVLLLEAFACALLAAMWSAVLVEVAAERQASHTEAVAHSESLARVLAGHVSHVLRQADHATQLYRLRHQSDGQAFTLAEFQRRGGLLDSVLPVRLELPMARFDRDGQQVDAVNQFGPSDVGNQPFFQTLAASSADSAVFSTIVTDSRASRWQIQVARRLSDKNNRFDGAVVMRIDPELFVDDYDRLNLDDNGAMLLMSPGDGLSVGRMATACLPATASSSPPSAHAAAPRPKCWPPPLPRRRGPHLQRQRHAALRPVHPDRHRHARRHGALPAAPHPVHGHGRHRHHPHIGRDRDPDETKRPAAQQRP